MTSHFILHTALALVAAGLVAVGLGWPSSQPARASINDEINFQGRLLTAAGAVIPDGNYNVEYKIYTGGTGAAAGDPGGTLQWTEDWTNTGGHPVVVKNGYFSIMLGSLTTLPSTATLDNPTIWLSMNVAAGANATATCGTFSACGGDGEMVPMDAFGAAPYAINAANADALGGISSTGYIQNVATNLTQQQASINLLNPAANAALAGVELQQTASATAPVLLLKGGATPGAGADLLQLQNSLAAVMDRFDSSGNLYMATGDGIDSQASSGTLVLGGTSSTTNATTIDLGVTGGSTAQTINVATSTNANTVNIASGAITSGAESVNIGTASSGSGKDTIIIGSANGNSTTTIEGGSSGTVGTPSIAVGNGITNHVIEIGSNSLSSNKVYVGSSGAGLVQTTAGAFQGLLQNTGYTLSDTTNSTSAFQIQDAGSAIMLAADTTNDKLVVTGGITVGFVAAPSTAPTLGLSGTAGNESSTTYYYEVTYVSPAGLTTDGGGETSAGPSASIADATSKQINLTNIPTGPAGEVTERIIYRTIAGGTSSGPYYVDDVIADNTTTLWTDNNSDATLVASDELLGSNTNTTGYFSNPQGETGSEVFGLGASADSQPGSSAFGYDANSYFDSVAVGDGANAYSSGSVAVGYNSQAANSGTAIGYDSNAGQISSTVVGSGATANGTDTLSLGDSALANSNNSIALGAGATTTATGQLVVGADGGSGAPISSVFIGNGVTDLTPLAVTIQGTSGLTGGGTNNIAGANLTLAGGIGTGTGNGGTLNFQIAKPSVTSGNTANTLATVASLSGVNGAALFKNSANSATGFQVQNAGSAALLTADTSNMRVDVGSGGTAVGQLYVSGNVPTAATGSSAALGGAPWDIKVVGNYAYVTVAATNSLQIVDISNPASPVNVGSVTPLGTPTYLAVQGKYAYVTEAGNKLEIFNIANPAAPVSVGSVATGTTPNGVYVQGKYAYVVNGGSNTMQVFDVSNPASPSSAGTALTLTTGTGPQDIFVQGQYAYITQYSTAAIEVVNISNPTAPTISGALSTGLTKPYDLYVQGQYAYITNNTSSSPSMQIVNVSNPASPSLTSTTVTGNGPSGIYVQGRYAYLTTYTADTLTTIDISSPASPAIVGTPLALGSVNPSSLVVQGRYAYVAENGSTKFQVFDMGGTYDQQLQAGGAEVGTLQVDSNANIYGATNIQGGLTVGGDTQLNGTMSAYTNTLSTTSESAAIYGYNSNTTGASNNGADGVYGYAAGYGAGAYGYSGNGYGLQGSSFGSTSGYFTSANGAGSGHSTLVVQQNSTSADNLITASLSSGGTLFNVGSAGQLTDAGSLNFTQTAAPSAAGLTLAAGTGTGLTGKYYYVVAYQTNLGQTNFGVVSPQSATLANTGMTVSNIPTGTVGVVTGREIYRTTGGGAATGPFYLDNTIADDTTTTYTDNVTDATLTTHAQGPTINTSGGSAGQLSLGGTGILQVDTNSTNVTLGTTLANNTSGVGNDVQGVGAMTDNTTGSNNVAIGTNVLFGNTTGYSNTIVGNSAFGSNTTGFANTAIGQNAGAYLQTSNGNTLLGYNDAGAVAETSGNDNTIVGGNEANFLGTTFGATGNIILGYGNFSTGTAQTLSGDVVLANNIVESAATAANYLDVGNVLFGNTSTGTGSIETTSATAFTVQTASAAATLFTVNTSAESVTVGPLLGDTTGDILVLGNKTNTGDPAGTAGAMYYNSSLGLFRCYENHVWVDCVSGLSNHDEFWMRPDGAGFVGVGLGTTLSGTTWTQSNQADNPYSLLSLSGIGTGQVGSTVYSQAERGYDPTCTFQVRTAGSVGSVRFWAGLFGAAPLTTTADAGGNYMAFRYDNADGDTGWVGTAKDNATQVTTSNVAAIAGAAAYTLRIRVDSATQNVFFSVNGSAEQSLTTHLPALTTNLGIAYSFTTTTGASTWYMGRAYCEEN